MFTVAAEKPTQPRDKYKILIAAFVIVDLVVAIVIGLLWWQLGQGGPINSSPHSQVTSTTTSLAPLDLTLVAKDLTIPDVWKQGAFASAKQLMLPVDFEISVYAVGLGKARFFDFDDAGNIIATDMGGGRLLFIQDQDADGVGETVSVIDEGLRNPHSVDLYKGNLYVGEEDKVSVYTNFANGEYDQKTILIPNLPAGGHSTRTVVVGPDEKLYVSIGSSCNVCVETDQRRAAIVQYNLDGTGQKIFASGLRNSVGLKFAPTGTSGANELWTVDNGRDQIGDDIPPEEVNVIEADGNYGWPYCYGNGVNNPEFADRAQYCAEQTKFPRYAMQAHSAPLGLDFPRELYSEATDFPDQLTQYLFIAFHGSWNRTVPTGYKVVTIDTANADAAAQDFITGWAVDGQAWGRPVGVVFGADGALYISDDQAGAIYRVVYDSKLVSEPLNFDSN